MISLKLVKGSELAEGVRAEMQLPASTPRFVIGRDPSAHWPIPDRTLAISARHCEMVAAHGGLVLRDLSTNGTFVNGSPARLAGEHPLQDGDRIELGPYTIVVQSGLPRPTALPAQAAPTPPPPPPARAAASPSVEATTPLRGGDPAAMLANAAGAAAAAPRVGLTEILRAAAPLVDESLEVTKIRMAPKPAAKPDRPAGSTPMPPVAATPPAAAPPPAPPVASATAAAPPLPPAAAGTEPTLAQLAAGLGLPADALAGHSAAQATAQVAALARAGVIALRALLEQQAQARRQIGSRAPALGALRELNALRLAATPEAALLALLAPGTDAAATLQRAGDELAAHQARLLSAFRTAGTRLGEEIAPASLQQALGAATPSTAQQAQLWALYTQVWQGLGLATGQPWAQGFQEAALMHLAAAYDDTGKT